MEALKIIYTLINAEKNAVEVSETPNCSQGAAPEAAQGAHTCAAN